MSAAIRGTVSGIKAILGGNLRRRKELQKGMTIAIILSGGSGTRLGTRIPKQYMEVGGKPILSYCLETLSGHGQIDALQVVAAPKWRERIITWLAEADVGKKFRGFSRPGENRQLSIYYALEKIRAYAGEDDRILIHDAARPLLSRRMVTRCLEALDGHDGVLPVLPMKDTLYLSPDGRTIRGLLERGAVYAGQAPEAFRFAGYYEANRKLLPEKIGEIRGSAEPAVMAGLDVVMIPGDEGNFKITTSADLDRFRRMVEK